MAQRRRNKRPNPKIDLSTVVKKRPRRKLAGNDNTKTRYSGLTFTQARQLERRIKDAAWQIKFAEMKLHHWRDPDNWNWEPLFKLLNQAKETRQQLFA